MQRRSALFTLVEPTVGAPYDVNGPDKRGCRKYEVKENERDDHAKTGRTWDSQVKLLIPSTISLTWNMAITPCHLAPTKPFDVGERNLWTEATAVDRFALRT